MLISDGLAACKKNDPKLNECLLNMMKQAKPQLLHGTTQYTLLSFPYKIHIIILYSLPNLLLAGNPELNLPPLDPVRISKISIRRTLQDIKVFGELLNLTAKEASSITVKTLMCVIF